MSNLGSRLKQAREDAGVDLREIASTTKISVATLEALERNEYSRLPGGIFSRSFVRSYAIAVGLDPEKTVDEFLLALRESERAAERTARTPEITADDRAFLARQQRALQQARYAGIGLLVALAVALVWWLSRPGDAPADPASVPGASAPSSPAGPPAPPAIDPSPVIDPPAAAAPPPVSAPPPDDPAAAAAVRLTIELDFFERCWIAITADDAMDARRLFVPGERHAVRAANEVVLNVGNAGGFRWTINGAPARPLGRSGATREVRITRDNYASFLQ
jgi:transcriptional regulator with XRE-family HTH domain